MDASGLRRDRRPPRPRRVLLNEPAATTARWRRILTTLRRSLPDERRVARRAGRRRHRPSGADPRCCATTCGRLPSGSSTAPACWTLGCGDGTLMANLRDSRGARVYGVEIADGSVLECVRRGLSVIQADLESGLRMFSGPHVRHRRASQTLQAMHQTEAVLREMARVGRQGIVSFPNFGHWRHLLSLLGGRMPVSPQMPYQWYDTPNVHLCTPKDFEVLAARLGTGDHRARAAVGRPTGEAVAEPARQAGGFTGSSPPEAVTRRPAPEHAEDPSRDLLVTR